LLWSLAVIVGAPAERRTSICWGFCVSAVGEVIDQDA
jgi:hypothetical protein